MTTPEQMQADIARYEREGRITVGPDVVIFHDSHDHTVPRAEFDAAVARVVAKKERGAL